jgi:pyruvate,water dikinase
VSDGDAGDVEALDGDVPVDAARFGGKAAQLATAAQAGLPVPRGFALATTLVEAAAAGAPAALATLARLARALDGALAVRSSAPDEDGAVASFAGQHLTRLGVRGAELPTAVRAVWQSARAESALAYRRRAGRHAPPRMAVVVQTLVDADVAGVLFTRNPLDGSDERVIEAAFGLGELVVSGRVTPDLYRLGRDGRVRTRQAGDKELALRCAEAGVVEEPLPPAQSRALCLDDAHLAALDGLARACEALFGGTQDLEWAFARERLWLLQRRPITSLPLSGGG